MISVSGGRQRCLFPGMISKIQEAIIGKQKTNAIKDIKLKLRFDPSVTMNHITAVATMTTSIKKK